MKEERCQNLKRANWGATNSCGLLMLTPSRCFKSQHYLSTQKHSLPFQLSIVRQKDKLEPWFRHYVVEDKGFNASHLSYVDFLCHVHKEIRNLLN